MGQWSLARQVPHRLWYTSHSNRLTFWTSSFCEHPSYFLSDDQMPVCVYNIKCAWHCSGGRLSITVVEGGVLQCNLLTLVLFQTSFSEKLSWGGSAAKTLVCHYFVVS